MNQNNVGTADERTNTKVWLVPSRVLHATLSPFSCKKKAFLLPWLPARTLHFWQPLGSQAGDARVCNLEKQNDASPFCFAEILETVTRLKMSPGSKITRQLSPRVSAGENSSATRNNGRLCWRLSCFWLRSGRVLEAFRQRAGCVRVQCDVACLLCTQQQQ